MLNIAGLIVIRVARVAAAYYIARKLEQQSAEAAE